MDDRDISFKNGDILAVTETHQDGWWKGELYDATRRQRGRDVFPCNYTVELGSPREEFASLPTTSDTDDCQSTLFYGACVLHWVAMAFILISTQPRLCTTIQRRATWTLVSKREISSLSQRRRSMGRGGVDYWAKHEGSLGETSSRVTMCLSWGNVGRRFHLHT